MEENSLYPFKELNVKFLIEKLNTPNTKSNGLFTLSYPATGII